MSKRPKPLTLDARQRYAPAEQSSCGNQIREYQPDTAVETKTRQHDHHTQTAPRKAAPTKKDGSRSPLPLDKTSYISAGGEIRFVPDVS